MSARHFFRCILVAALPLWGAGCAQFDWRKAGATEADTERDYARCAAQARSEALRRLPILQPPEPRMVLDRNGRVIAVNPAADNSERFLLEHDLIRLCMTGLGYALQPKQPAVNP